MNFRTLFHVDLRDHAGLGRMDSHEPLLRHQPASNSRLASIVGEEQQPQNGRSRKRGEDSEQAVRKSGRDQHRAEPFRLALGEHRLTKEGLVHGTS